jgi:hypothetical protein
VNAVLFFDALHHVVDERRTLKLCFDALRPGGVIGIREGAWIPGRTAFEDSLREEMQKFGTLENPFTAEYLDSVLAETGFIGITRYVPVNGYFAVECGDMSLPSAADGAPEHLNDLTAFKPTCDRRLGSTPGAKIEILAAIQDTTRHSLAFNLKLTNTGDTIWQARGASQRGATTVALRRGAVASAQFQESLNRHAIPTTVLPGQSIDMSCEFKIPSHEPLDGWHVYLVCEGAYWFSHRANSLATRCGGGFFV